MTNGERLTIGEFARLVGISVSALRFYDRCDLIEPAEVDPHTGYRSYDRSQLPSAQLIRALRLGEMSVPAIREVLATEPHRRAALIEAHRQQLESRFELVADHMDDAIALVGHEEVSVSTTLSVESHDLRTALAQVLHAADPQRLEVPALTGILVEVGADLRLVATDSYRLAVADRIVLECQGEPTSIVIGALELAAVSEGLPTSGVVTMTIAGDGLALTSTGLDIRLTALAMPYPDYRPLLPTGGLSRRALVDRAALSRALNEYLDDDVVALTVEERTVGIASRDGTRTRRLSCESWGDPITVGVNPRFLLSLVDAAQGADVTFEVERADAPTVIRSATDGSYTALLMPIGLAAA